MPEEISEGLSLELATTEQIAQELRARQLEFTLCVVQGGRIRVMFADDLDLGDGISILVDAAYGMAAAGDIELSFSGVQITCRSRTREAVAWCLLAFAVGIAIVEGLILAGIGR